MNKTILSWFIVIGSILGVMYLGWAGRMDYLFECAWRLVLGCDKWWEYGGFHRLTLIIVEVIIMYAIGMTYLWLRRRKK